MSNGIKPKAIRNQKGSKPQDTKREPDNKKTDFALKGISPADDDKTGKINSSELKSDSSTGGLHNGGKTGSDSSWQFMFLLAAMGIALLFMILKIIGII